MAEQDPPRRAAAAVNRIFEQPNDSLSMYSDFAQVVGTGHEVILQFYETIPGTPGPSGTPEMVRTRLRATITVSKAHASNIGRLLQQHSLVEPATPATPEGE